MISSSVTIATTLLLGVGMGLGLIAAVGAQNAYLLQRSIRGDVRMAPLVLFCIGSEALLLTLGVAGVGTLVDSAPWAMSALRWVGAVFLLVYGGYSAWRVIRPAEEALEPGESGAPTPGLLGAVAACAAFTWLNPHAYLDTVVFLGSLANQQGPGLRWVFAGGAFVAGILWFSAIGFGGRALRGVFARPAAWRVLDAVVAVMMVGLAVHIIVS